MTAVPSGTSKAPQALDNREHMFRLQMLIIDGGLLVLRNYVDQKLTASTTSLGACLAKEKSTIMRLKGNKTITQEQYDLLYPSSGNVSTSDLDITLIVFLLRSLKFFVLDPNFKWNTLPAPGDTSIEAAIYNLKRYRNEISHVSTTTGFQQSTFKTLWKKIKEILLRINSFSVANPIADLKQTIKDFKSRPLDPKIEKRVQDEIEEWKKLEKAVEVDLAIVRADNKGIKQKIKIFEQLIQEQTMRQEDVEVVKKDVKVVKQDVKIVKQDLQRVEQKIAKIEKEIKSKDNLKKTLTESEYKQRKQGSLTGYQAQKPW